MEVVGIVGILLYFAFVLFMFLVSVGGTIFWIWMLIDCLKNESSEGNDKIIWAIVILCTHFLGGLLHFFI